MRFLKATAMFSTLAMLALISVGTAGAQPTTKTVTCKDGTSSKGGKGACSGHGGIADAAAVKTAPTKTPPAKTVAPATPQPATSKAVATTTPPAKSKSEVTTPAAKAAAGKATATCKDGTKSYATTHTGACSSHGGVAEWLDGTKKP